MLGQVYEFKDVKDVLAKASEKKSGDELAGVAAESKLQRIAAKEVLGQLTVGDLRDAVITGTKHRFRPILMTATVAVLGLLPASVSTGIGSDVQRPLATVIVYGLLFATVITLYVLPALYYMIEKHYEGKDLTPVSEEKELHA